MVRFIATIILIILCTGINYYFDKYGVENQLDRFLMILIPTLASTALKIFVNNKYS